MKVTQEDFNKLKQLDRIEYRQKEDRIIKWNDESYGYAFLKSLALIIIVEILLLPQAYLFAGKEIVIDLINVFSTAIGFFLALTIGGFLVDAVFMGIRLRNLKELKEEYFKVENKK